MIWWIRHILGLPNVCWRCRNSGYADMAQGQYYRVEHDGFEGIEIGSYMTLEGKKGAVLQQLGTRVVHVYGRKWLTPISPDQQEPK